MQSLSKLLEPHLVDGLPNLNLCGSLLGSEYEMSSHKQSGPRWNKAQK